MLELAVLLREHCPPDLKVKIAPFDVALSDSTVMQPDVLVARRAWVRSADVLNTRSYDEMRASLRRNRR